MTRAHAEMIGSVVHWQRYGRPVSCSAAIVTGWPCNDDGDGFVTLLLLADMYDVESVRTSYAPRGDGGDGRWHWPSPACEPALWVRA